MNESVQECIELLYWDQAILILQVRECLLGRVAHPEGR